MRRHAVVAALAFGVIASTSSCSKTPTPDASGTSATSTSTGVTTATLPWTAPTKTQVADATGLLLPASVADFRSTSISPRELDVSFTIAAADVEAFARDSALALVEGQRVITHGSPLWDLNPEGTTSGAATERNGYRRVVEVVTAPTDPTVASVRLVITPGTTG